ncbi:MAG TPA: nuclear transport factor 2 family protein [Labilithrix sp.]|jgi:ketosteroid isomerase-like protein|nr:nuclear transport factor 2 family protein [Labilithrix sp.]
MNSVNDVRSSSSTTSRTDAESTALATFRRYNDAFRALDARAVSTFFHEPALLFSPRGDFALPHAADVERTYAGVMKEAKARGYMRTAFDALQACSFGTQSATVEGHGAWIGTNGEVLMRFECSYVLRRVGDVWKIALAMVRAA